MRKDIFFKAMLSREAEKGLKQVADVVHNAPQQKSICVHFLFVSFSCEVRIFQVV